jgi:hypothetical protein
LVFVIAFFGVSRFATRQAQNSKTRKEKIQASPSGISAHKKALAPHEGSPRGRGDFFIAFLGVL